jgi:hypothetical protein
MYGFWTFFFKVWFMILILVITYILFHRGFEVSCSISWNPIYFPAVVEVLQSCTSVGNSDPILFSSTPFSFLRKNLCIPKLHVPPVLADTLPDFCNYTIVIIITISSSEALYMKYTRIPLVCQDAKNVVVNLAISEGPGVLINAGMGVIHACEVSSFRYGKVYYFNAMILIVVM